MTPSSTRTRRTRSRVAHSCTTTAISFQVVAIVGHADIVVPQNLSGALNYDCVSCVTRALAVQLVVTLPAHPERGGDEGTRRAVARGACVRSARRRPVVQGDPRPDRGVRAADPRHRREVRQAGRSAGRRRAVHLHLPVGIGYRHGNGYPELVPIGYADQQLRSNHGLRRADAEFDAELHPDLDPELVAELDLGHVADVDAAVDIRSDLVATRHRVRQPVTETPEGYGLLGRRIDPGRCRPRLRSRSTPAPVDPTSQVAVAAFVVVRTIIDPGSA